MDESTVMQTIRVVTEQGRPCWYPDTAILTQEEVAAVLGVSLRTVVRLSIPCYRVSDTRCRYLYGDVVAYLKDRPAA